MAKKTMRTKASKNLQKDASDEAGYDQVLTNAEVAKLLRVSERTVYRFRTEMRLPALKLGTCLRYRRTEVLEWAFTHGRIGRPDGQE